MQPVRRTGAPPPLRARLGAGAALAVWAPLAAAAPAWAQQAAAPPAAATAADETPGEDGLPPRAVYVEADRAWRDGDRVHAEAEPGGDRVLARARQHVLRAERLSYDLETGEASAEGRVEVIAPDGSEVHASRVELDSDFAAGVAVDFATRLQNGASLMAATAVRRSETVNQLNYAVFTPCPVCDENGRPKEPSLSIQAESVVQDEGLRAILYRNAVFRLGGVPVLYLPVFAHPDPSVERASGLLPPVVNYDEGRGLSVETPYLMVVSPSEDWLFSPQFNTDVTPLLNVQWRRRFADGMAVARAGYTYARNFGDFDLDGDGDAESNVRFGPRESRGYLLAWGRFDPDGPWRWGFTAERTSDKTLFDRYDVSDPYQDNGLYYGDRRRLISQVYAERQTRRSYLSVAAFTLQSLRVARFDPVTPALNVFEDDDALPVVAPLVELRWEPEDSVLGGRLRLRATAAALFRDAFVGAPVLRPSLIPGGDTTGLDGVDSRRLLIQAEWRRVLISPMGVRWEPFLDVRADMHAVSDLPPPMDDRDLSLGRERVTAGLDVSYPLIRRFETGADMVLEPMAQLTIGSDPRLDRRIPNEDSHTIELDQSSLFRLDRFPGQDLMEGGLRFTAGMRGTVTWDAGRSASLFVGRSFRGSAQTAFRIPIPDRPDRLYDPSGLASQTSDWVVQGTFAPSDRIRGWGHATVDGSGDIRRAETAVDGRWGRRNLASVSYILDRSNPAPGPLNRNYEFVQLSGQQFVAGNWGVAFAGVGDLNRNEITRSEVGLLFDDDCFRLEIGFRRDNTRVRPSGPTEGVYVRLNLATFGGSVYGRDEWR